MITIKIDSREKIKLQTSELKKKYNVIEYKYDDDTAVILPVGDVEITDGTKSVYIEVKKGNDLFSSKLKKTLDAQIGDLLQVDYGIVAFVGDLYDFNNAIDKNGNAIPGIDLFYKDFPKRIVGLKTSISGRVKFVEYRDLYELEMGIAYWANQIKTKKLDRNFQGGKVGRILQQSSLGTIEARKIGILSQLSGIGKGVAKKILEAFGGDVQNALNAADEEWLEIKGIKKKKVEALRELGFKPAINFNKAKYHDDTELFLDELDAIEHDVPKPIPKKKVEKPTKAPQYSSATNREEEITRLFE